MDRRTIRRIGGPYDRPTSYTKKTIEQNVPSNCMSSSSSSSSSSNSSSSNNNSSSCSSSSSSTSTSNTLLKSETGFNRTGFNREVLPAYTAVSPLLKLAERRDCTTRRKLALASDSCERFVHIIANTRAWEIRELACSHAVLSLAATAMFAAVSCILAYRERHARSHPLPQMLRGRKSSV